MNGPCPLENEGYLESTTGPALVLTEKAHQAIKTGATGPLLALSGMCLMTPWCTCIVQQPGFGQDPLVQTVNIPQLAKG